MNTPTGLYGVVMPNGICLLETSDLATAQREADLFGAAVVPPKPRNLAPSPPLTQTLLGALDRILTAFVIGIVLALMILAFTL